MVNGRGCLKAARSSGKAQARLGKWKEENRIPRNRDPRGNAPLGRFPHGPWAVLGPWHLTAAPSGLTGTTGGTHGSVSCPEGLGTVSLAVPLPIGPVLQSRADGQDSSHLSTWISHPLRFVPKVVWPQPCPCLRCYIAHAPTLILWATESKFLSGKEVSSGYMVESG